MKNQSRILMFILPALLLACSLSLFAAGSTAKNSLRIAPATVAGKLDNGAFRNLTALCESNNQMYGAGTNTVAVIGEDGKVTRSIQTAIANVGGISGYSGDALIIGDSGNNTIHMLNLQTGKTSQLLALGTLNFKRDGRSVFSYLPKVGKLSSVAYDGAFVYAGVSAGFSSFVLKIDVKSNSVAAQTFAPGDSPNAMTAEQGNLFVLNTGTQQVRRFSSGDMQLANAAVTVPVTDAMGLILRNNEVRVLSPQTSQILRLNTDLTILRNPVIAAAVLPIGILHRVPVLAPQKYAILITGDVAEHGFPCFWYDTVWMYKSLIDAGYEPRNIFVLYGEGVDGYVPNPFYQYPDTITNYRADVANVNMLLDGLKNGDPTHGIPKMTDQDTLFLWTFDHGGRDDTSGHVCLCLRGGVIWDDEMSAKLNALPYKSRAIFMQQCFCGGFIPYLQNNKTFISCAAMATQIAHGSFDPAICETYNGTLYWHGEYNYWIISALSGKRPTGVSITAAADGNHNCWVCGMEAHGYEASQHHQPEIPQASELGTVGSTYRWH